MFGFKYSSGCMSHRCRHNHRRLDRGHCADRWDCEGSCLSLCIWKREISGCSVKRV